MLWKYTSLLLASFSSENKEIKKKHVTVFAHFTKKIQDEMLQQGKKISLHNWNIQPNLEPSLLQQWQSEWNKTLKFMCYRKNFITTLQNCEYAVNEGSVISPILSSHSYLALLPGKAESLNWPHLFSLALVKNGLVNKKWKIKYFLCLQSEV